MALEQGRKDKRMRGIRGRKKSEQWRKLVNEGKAHELPASGGKKSDDILNKERKKKRAIGLENSGDG